MTKKDQPQLTLKTVADLLEVSTATISNAFNRPDQLSEQLREKILSECQRIGYHGPNLAARSLRTGATGVVGVMLADNLSYNFSDPCAIQFLQGVSQVLDDAQINMLMMPGREGFYQEKSLEALPERYILYGPPQDIPLISRIERQHKPMVTVDFELPNHLSINVDNYGGAKLAAKHVLQNASGTVAIIGLRLTVKDISVRLDNHELRTPDFSISRQRLEAYLDAAKEEGKEIPNHLIWSTAGNKWQEGVQAAREALSCNPRPEALLCMSDQLALATLSVARELDIKVPEQLKIIGFDDTPAAKQSHPSLSTVYQPSTEKGQLAAMMVLHPEHYESRVLPTSLKLRSTT